MVSAVWSFSAPEGFQWCSSACSDQSCLCSLSASAAYEAEFSTNIATSVKASYLDLLPDLYSTTIFRFISRFIHSAMTPHIWKVKTFMKWLKNTQFFWVLLMWGRSRSPTPSAVVAAPPSLLPQPLHQALLIDAPFLLHPFGHCLHKCTRFDLTLLIHTSCCWLFFFCTHTIMLTIHTTSLTISKKYISTKCLTGLFF